MKWLIRAVKPLAVQLALLALQGAVDMLVEKLPRNGAPPQPANDQ